MQNDKDRLNSLLEQVIVRVKHPDWRVRVLAVKSLEQYGHHVPMPVLASAVMDAHRSVRVAALETCEALAVFVPVALVEIGLSDPAWSVRAAAAWALGSFADRAPVPRLLALFQDPEEYELVRASALYALGVVLGRDFHKQIIEALNDSACAVREEAALLLGNLRERRGIPSLITTCQSDREPLVRGAALLALIQVEDETLKGVLYEALQDADGYVRNIAAKALHLPLEEP